MQMHKAILSLFVLATLGAGLTACGTGSAQTHEFNVKVTGTKSDLGDLSVKKGDTVKLTITTDKDEQVHLHGYDIHFDCKANTPLTKTFTADKTGQFEYELEATTDHLGNLTVNP
jgi:FtsP/CotA-like multicopper oxidase with cupredoxin domain